VALSFYSIWEINEIIVTAARMLTDDLSTVYAGTKAMLH
jgi:hypothetical protein